MPKKKLTEKSLRKAIQKMKEANRKNPPVMTKKGELIITPNGALFWNDIKARKDSHA